MIEKAVIPCGGLGTRLRPMTEFLPKELLPLGLKPLLYFAIEEAGRSGIKEAILVINPQKGMIEDYIKGISKECGKDGEFYYEDMKISIVHQHSPIGLADAISCAEALVGNKPFAVILPDGIMDYKDPPLREMEKVFERYHKDTVACIELKCERAREFGNCGAMDVEEIEGDALLIRSLSSKNEGHFTIKPGKTRLKGFPRYILTSKFFHYLKEMRNTIKEGEELDDVPIFQRMIAEGILIGKSIKGVPFDVGNPTGYFSAFNYSLCDLWDSSSALRNSSTSDFVLKTISSSDPPASISLTSALPTTIPSIEGARAWAWLAFEIPKPATTGRGVHPRILLI